MANVVKHRFASGKTDGADATQVQPSHWNDGHQFTGGVAGDLLTRDPTDAIFGAKWAPADWTAFTPTWMSDPPPGPTIGNGQLAGVYNVVGKTIHYQIRFMFGSTTSGVTAGAWWAFFLPIAAARTGALGTAWMQNGANNQYFVGTCFPGGWASGNLVGGVSVLCPIVGATNSGILQPTLPFTWVANSWLYLAGTYDIGSAVMSDELKSDIERGKLV